MGESASVSKEHLLIVSPVPEPAEIIKEISRKFPNLELTFIHLPLKGVEKVLAVPRGQPYFSPLIFNLIR
jgi:hypothetical protein